MKIRHLLSFVVIGAFIVAQVAAQTPSPSVTSAGTIRDAVKDQVAKELSNIKQGVAKKAYVGSIASKADLTLTITNLNNQTRTATVTTDTVIKLTGGKDGTPADLKVDDFVIAMGDVDSNGGLTARRLLVITKPAADTRDSTWVTVTKVTTTALTAENTKKESWNIKLSSSTKYTGTTKAADIKVGSKIVAVGSVSQTTLTAGLIQLLP